MKKMTEADVLWVPAYAKAPDAGDICVRRHGTHHRPEYPKHMWMPVANAFNFGCKKAKTENEKLLSMFILFNTITVRDGIDVKKAHDAFLAIDEYRQTISPDAPGAEAA
jgi:hypothetical protein